MGLILDIVPNHMAVCGGNAWWQDVLEWGHDSPYAEYFDIDWKSNTPGLRGRVLAPFLGDPYGVCLREGQIGLRFDPADGRLYVTYCDERFPLAPRDYPAVLVGSDALAEVVSPLAALPHAAGEREAAREQAAAVRQALRAPALAPAIASALEVFDPTRLDARARLHHLLERQAYRLAWWRASERDQLAPLLRHQRFGRGARGAARGVRGNPRRRPAALCRRPDRRRADRPCGRAGRSALVLPHAAPAPGGARRDPPDRRRPPGPAPIWVEKILGDGEHLPIEWQTDGTTGYDFMDQAASVLHDPAGEPMLTAAWVRATGRPAAFATEVDAARHQ